MITHTARRPTASHTLQPADHPQTGFNSDADPTVTADAPQGLVTDGAPASVPLRTPLPVDGDHDDPATNNAQTPCCTPPSLHELACGDRWKIVRRVAIGVLVFGALMGGGCAIVLNPGIRRRTFVSEVVAWATRCLGSGVAGEAESVANDYFDRLNQAHQIPVDLGACPPSGADITAVLIDRFDDALADAPTAAGAATLVPPLLLAFALWVLLRRLGLLDG